MHPRQRQPECVKIAAALNSMPEFVKADLVQSRMKAVLVGLKGPRAKRLGIGVWRRAMAFCMACDDESAATRCCLQSNSACHVRDTLPWHRKNREMITHVP